MKKTYLLFLAFLSLFLLPKNVFAEGGSITLKTDFNTWKVYIDKTDWTAQYPKTYWNGIEVKIPEYTNTDLRNSANPYLQNISVQGVDNAKIREYIDKVIQPIIHRDKADVKIKTDESGKIIFDGFAMAGKDVDMEKAVSLIKTSYSGDHTDVRIPILTTQPSINIESEDLKSKGITSLLATGETNFSGSPSNRRVNIRVGLASFSGKLIAPKEEGSAINILGRVDGSTGYLQELVIKGDKTVPEYGGGLCQVSTTVYRSILMAGLPITERTNHSYAVSYYDPQGLDATIYQPHPDMRFINDTPNYILIQTTTVGEKAYSNIYGTPVDRDVELIGPYYYDYKPIPPPRTEYTDKLPIGTKQQLGGAHAGFKASWYRRISYDDGSKPDVINHIYSSYEARPLYTLIGGPKPTADLDKIFSVF